VYDTATTSLSKIDIFVNMENGLVKNIFSKMGKNGDASLFSPKRMIPVKVFVGEF
jgi:hypothetical protein